MIVLFGAYQYINTIKVITNGILIFHTRNARLTKRDDQGTEEAVGHDDGKHTQHPGVLGAILELPNHSLYNTARDNSLYQIYNVKKFNTFLFIKYYDIKQSARINNLICFKFNSLHLQNL